MNAIEKKNNWKAKTIKIVFFIIFIFFISGISSVFFDKYVFPRLASNNWFKKQPFFKQTMDNVTVINKTEQVTINENQNISSYTSKAASSVVEIISRRKEGESAVSQVDQSRSGIIVTSDGMVASYGEKFFSGIGEEYKVFLSDGKSYDAKVAAADSFSNMVLLKLNGVENLPVAEFIASEDIKTGMKIALIGRSGFNSEISLRLGITSEWAKAYSLAGPLASSEKMQGLLFADFFDLENIDQKKLAGGAVVDQNGNMIGILGERKEDNGAKFFIVPINHLQDIINQYIQKGKIERAALGVYYLTLSKETAYLSRNNFDRGALVYSLSKQQGLAVVSGSAADKAGIKIGDVILSVNGNELNPDQNLAYLISRCKPGDNVELKINRNGQEMVIQAALQ